MSVLLLVLTGLAAQLHAQLPARTISGIITQAETNTPVEGATISAGRHQTVSRKDGSFQIEVADNTRTLTITHSSFTLQEVKLTSTSSYNVTLQSASKQLDDVIVTGYSTQNKRFIAGSIASISADDIKNIPAAGFNQLLQGKAAGVQVTANSGVPGGGVTFRVRGNNSINASADPLYIIDGVIVSNTDLIRTSLGNQQQSNQSRRYTEYPDFKGCQRHSDLRLTRCQRCCDRDYQTRPAKQRGQGFFTCITGMVRRAQEVQACDGSGEWFTGQ